MSAFVFLVQSTEFSDTRTECSTHTRADYYRYNNRVVQMQGQMIEDTRTFLQEHLRTL